MNLIIQGPDVSTADLKQLAKLTGANGIEHRQGFAARHHVVFRNEFQPVHRLRTRQKIGIVLGAQPQPEAG